MNINRGKGAAIKFVRDSARRNTERDAAIVDLERQQNLTVLDLFCITVESETR